MRISKLLMPAVTVAGALALAGCGGGSGTMPESEKCDEGYTGTPPDCKKIVVVEPEPGPDAAAIAEAIGDHKTTGGATLPRALFGSAMVAHKDGATEITITRRNGTRLTGDAASHPVSGWSGRSYEFTDGGVENQGAVFSDIHGPQAEAYDTFFGTDGSGGNVDGLTYASANGALTFAASPEDTFKAENFAGAILTAEPSDGQTTSQTVPAAGLTGSYYGVAGKFTCGTAGCGVTRDDDGNIQVTEQSLIFTPELDGREQSDVPVIGARKDTAYLHFGYWYNGERLDTFAGAGGADYILTGDVSSLAAGTTATYSGAAGGAYVHGNAAGNFAADADLTANFTAGVTVAADDAYSISGKISDFRSTSGGGDLKDWELTLGKIAFDNGSTARTWDDLTGTTTSKDAANGKWNVRLYGSSATGAPTAATGEFNGNFGAGSHAAGAFGATSD